MVFGTNIVSQCENNRFIEINIINKLSLNNDNLMGNIWLVNYGHFPFGIMAYYFRKHNENS